MNGLDTFEGIKKATSKNKKAEVTKLMPLIPTTVPDGLVPQKKSKDAFVEDLSVSILMALIEHSGKCLGDHVDIAVDRAIQLAERLGYDD